MPPGSPSGPGGLSLRPWRAPPPALAGSPPSGLGGLTSWPEALQVDHDALLAAAGDDHDGLLVAGILLPVRDVGRHEDVVARLSVQPDLLAAVGEDERGGPGQDVDRCLRLAVVMVAGPGAGRHVRLAHPDLFRSGVLARDGLAPDHPGGLAGVIAELPAADLGQRAGPEIIDRQRGG